MAQETETPAVELAMVSCAACDLMFMASERRQTCPTCGGEAAGPYFEFVLDESGLHQKDGVRAPLISREEAVQRLKDVGYPEEEAEARVDRWDEDRDPAAEAPAAEAAVEEPAPIMAGPAEGKVPIAAAMIAGFLAGEESDVEVVKDWLIELGAEREAAVTAVGRLTAVRDLISELAGAGLEPVVEAEVEVSPETAPETSPAGDNGSEAP